MRYGAALSSVGDPRSCQGPARVSGSEAPLQEGCAEGNALLMALQVGEAGGHAHPAQRRGGPDLKVL